MSFAYCHLQNRGSAHGLHERRRFLFNFWIVTGVRPLYRSLYQTRIWGAIKATNSRALRGSVQRLHRLSKSAAYLSVEPAKRRSDFSVRALCSLHGRFARHYGSDLSIHGKAPEEQTTSWGIPDHLVDGFLSHSTAFLFFRVSHDFLHRYRGHGSCRLIWLRQAPYRHGHPCSPSTAFDRRYRRGGGRARPHVDRATRSQDDAASPRLSSYFSLKVLIHPSGALLPHFVGEGEEARTISGLDPSAIRPHALVPAEGLEPPTP